MSGGSGAASPAGEGGSYDWRHIYDRVEAMLPRVEALAADRARLEALDRTQRDLSGARENSLHARLLQAKSSRKRWKTAYIELPLLANPKIIELQENDMEDSRNRHVLFDVDNSGPKMQQKEATRHELSDNNVDYENIARDLRAELRELKQAAEAAQKLQQNIEELQAAAGKKDDEISRLRAEVLDAEIQLREMEEVNTALLKIKEVEGAQTTEATHKLQKNVKELQVAARDKNDEICRLQAEAVASKNKLLAAKGKLNEIQKLKDGQLEATHKLQKNVKELQVAARDKNDEIRRLRAEALASKNKLLVAEGKLDEIQKFKDGQLEATDKLQKNVKELQVAAKDKNDEIRRLQAEALASKNKLLVAEGKLDEIQKLKDGQLEATLKLQKNVKELQVAAKDKNDENRRLQAEALASKNKLLVAEGKLGEIQKLKDGQLEATHKLQKNVRELQVAARDKNDETSRLQGEALASKNKLLVAKGKLDEDGQLESLKRKRTSLPNTSIQIAVKIISGEKITLMVETSDTVESVKAKIQDKVVGLRPCDQSLCCDSKELNDRCTLAEYNIGKNSTFNVYTQRNYIYVYTTSSPGKVMTLMVERSDTIADVKSKILIKEGILPSRQDLWFCEQLLEKSRTLGDYDIERGSRLSLHVRPE